VSPVLQSQSLNHRADYLQTESWNETLTEGSEDNAYIVTAAFC